MLQRRKANNPKQPWSKAEEQRLLNYIKKYEFNAEFLLENFPGRELPSIRSKVRKLRIKHDLFGDSYREDKENFTSEIAAKIKPKIVFDAYAGVGHQTFKWAEMAKTVYATEINKSKKISFKKNALSHGFCLLGQEGIWTKFERKGTLLYFYSGDSLDGAIELKARKIAIDLVDLDTCGSTIPTLPYFLLLLKPRHLVITHGEFHSMRFKREDVLRRLLAHRDVNLTPFPLDVDEMAVELDKAVKIAALRAHNETHQSFWMKLIAERWLGGKFHGMLRRHYRINKPAATSDCLNIINAL